MFKTIEESQITLTQLMLPSHSNFSGKIHGGFILSLMDQIAFACASKHSRTDAFAVCNYLELYRQTGEQPFLQLAVLPENLYHTLSSYHPFAMVM